jgi:hypothetical protein
LEQLVEREAVTWLDLEPPDTSGATRGFGREIADARGRRQAWLRLQGLSSDDGKLSRAQAEELRRREIEKKGSRMTRTLGKIFVATRSGDHVEGEFTKAVDLAAGRYAVIERSKEFTLVPWRETLEKRRGQSVVGIMRGGGVSWQFGRKRGRTL